MRYYLVIIKNHILNCYPKNHILKCYHMETLALATDILYLETLTQYSTTESQEPGIPIFYKPYRSMYYTAIPQMLAKVYKKTSEVDSSLQQDLGGRL